MKKRFIVKMMREWAEEEKGILDRAQAKFDIQSNLAKELETRHANLCAWLANELEVWI